MSDQEKFMLWIPSAKRKMWGKFREHVENLGKPVSDVIIELVEGYMGEKE